VKYRVQVTCPDCTYEDPQGCNLGDPWYVGEHGGLDAPTLFDTREAAEAAGWAAVKESIYEFTVEEVDA
jgi:hypothetical protein